MARGNRREVDRQRAANRHAGKGEKKSGDPTARKAADGEALQAKIAAKAAAKAAAGGGSGGGGTKKT